MKTQDFSFDLPERLIAQTPPPERGLSRLMVLDRASRTWSHRMAADLPDILESGSLLVFNDSRVRKARLYGESKSSGAGVEFLLLQKLDAHTWRAMVRRSRRRRPGSRYAFPGGLEGEILGADGDFRILRFDAPVDDAWLDIHGRIPLPPYIRRQDTPEDADRYQTVYAAAPGSAAAPTAGLHFTRELLARLEDRGIETAFLTLHVGLGTFLPVRTADIEDHRMHEETYGITEETASRIEKARAEGRKVVAVGTTSVRTLESAWKNGRLARGEGVTSIFIYPGYTFKAVDALFTNFHTPRSTLLMLVAAFAEAGTSGHPAAGRDFILESYACAIREEYRFFSYGDAMLIL
ncbi:MAG: tRNA preQ1(34) S-adenosylmethionine ribosyltransferase-isomerase QueA [Treponema sp.]|jgi:S-adenosylmethionine:tRNA ribosyltransferase-isomerase|nr:tRNA preQ1(34) S-adenosylmethionine ribosyltransferase-isomerase QueA [Treponema sp.]